MITLSSDRPLVMTQSKFSIWERGRAHGQCKCARLNFNVKIDLHRGLSLEQHSSRLTSDVADMFPRGRANLHF